MINPSAKPVAPDRLKWMRYIWVVYSIFFVIDPIQRGSTHRWVLFAIAYPVFLVLFVLPHHLKGWKQIAAVGAMFLLGLIYVPYNLSACGIFVFAAATLPFCISSARIVLLSIAAGCLVILAEGLLLHMSIWSWGSGIFFSLVVGAANTALAQDRAANTKLRLAYEEVEQLAKVAERERIARDMHDVLGHTLSLIVLKAQLAEKLVTRDPERAASEIRDVEGIARKALTEVREAIRGYRSEGLTAEIERARRTLDAAGVAMECDCTPPVLNAARETVLSLILREAVTNIVRHAHASRCKLNFATLADSLTLTIEDNGCGGTMKEGNGLRGMRERIEAMSGRLMIESEKGTRLTVQLPVLEPNQVATTATVAS